MNFPQWGSPYVPGSWYNRVSEITDRSPFYTKKKPKVALLKKLLCDAGIISALDQDSKPVSKLTTKR